LNSQRVSTVRGRIVESYIEERAVELANYIVENKATVRAAAKKIWNKQKHCSQGCDGKTSANQFRPGRAGKGGIDKNKAERHIRGGMATKAKYKGNVEAKK